MMYPSSYLSHKISFRSKLECLYHVCPNWGTRRSCKNQIPSRSKASKRKFDIHTSYGARISTTVIEEQEKKHCKVSGDEQTGSSIQTAKHESGNSHRFAPRHLKCIQYAVSGHSMQCRWTRAGTTRNQEYHATIRSNLNKYLRQTGNSRRQIKMWTQTSKKKTTKMKNSRNYK